MNIIAFKALLLFFLSQLLIQQTVYAASWSITRYRQFNVFIIIFLALIIFISIFFIVSRQLSKKNKEIQDLVSFLGEKGNLHQDILNNSPLATIIWDKNLIIKEWNKASENIFGWTRDEVLNRKRIDIIIPDINKKSFNEFYNIFQKTPNYITHNNITKSNNTVICEWTNTILNNPINNEQYILSFGKEITEWIDIESKLNDQKKSLELYSSQLELHIDELEFTNKQVEELSNKFEKMIDLTNNLYESTHKNEKDFLSNLLHTAFVLIPEADYGSVYIYKDDKVKFIDTVGHDLEALQQLSIRSDIFAESNDEITIMKNTVDFTSELLTEEIKEQFVTASLPMKETLKFDLYIKEERIAGVSLDIAKGQGKSFGENSTKIMLSFRNLANAFFTIQRYSQNQQDFQKELVLSIIQLLELHDMYTNNHSHNVALLSQKIAEQLGLSKNDIINSYWAGLVHDIGKILISSDILNKKDRLNTDEFENIKKHPYWGYKTLIQTQHLKDIAKYVLHHHENWNGTGYPDGLKGNEIPLISQIITVADSWDAMRSDRSYRLKLPKTVALNEILNKKGTQFSPTVVDAFLRVLESEEELISKII